MTPTEKAIYVLHSKGLISNSGLIKISQIKKESQASSGMWPITRNVMYGTGLLTLAGLGGIAAVRGAKTIHQKVTLKKSFESMINKYPELNKYPAEEVKEKFDVLAKFAPTLAESPVVAKTFVNEMLQYEGVDPARIKQLIEAQQGADTGSAATAMERTFGQISPRMGGEVLKELK